MILTTSDFTPHVYFFGYCADLSTDFEYALSSSAFDCSNFEGEISSMTATSLTSLNCSNSKRMPC